jgi:hypothetical protein
MSPSTQNETDAGSPSGTTNGDESLIDYMENAPQPLPPRDPIGPPDVQPGEAPIRVDE